MPRIALERSLHILAPVLGRKRGVEVVIGGTAMCTDGNTVFLPSLPPDDAEAAIIGFGGLFHETNHIRYTDFSIDKPPGFLGSLFNVIEDIRIDRLGHQEYPGGRLEEDLLVAALLQRGEARHAQPGDSPASILESYVMWRLESEVLGITSATSLAQSSEALARSTFPIGAVTKLDALMFEVLNCTSTADALDLAERIYTMLEQEAAHEDESHASLQTPPAGSLREALDADDSQHAKDLGELISAALEQKAADVGSESFALPVADQMLPTSLSSAHVTFAEHVRASANALIQRVSGLLQAQTLSRTSPCFAGKRLDLHRLHRVAFGDSRVFRRRISGSRMDTAIQICLDRSGSMDGREIQIAREACFATALAMQSFQGVSVAVAAFPGANSEVSRVTSFHERVDHCVPRFASLDADGGTPMAEAMLWAAAELLHQPRPRRILLIITDGKYDAPRGHRMVSALQSAGIEPIAIGVGCEVRHLFRVGRAIANVTDLPSAMFSLLLAALQTRVSH